MTAGWSASPAARSTPRSSGTCTLRANWIGALCALDYVNRFPGEVRAVVSIDGSVPIDAVDEGGQSRWLRLWTISGVLRWVTKFAPDLVVQAPPDTYSADARRQMPA